MSRRPQVHSISTNTSRDNVNTGRVSTDSGHAPIPAPYLPTLSDTMSLRAGKRPLESPSRGESPPDKRSRLPNSRSTLQDRYANSTGSRIQSPPPSRKSSLAGRSNVPTSPRLASDQHRLESTKYQRRQDSRAPSPSSIERGPSTSTHYVPPAPSMLPAADLSALRRSADVTSSAMDDTPITMQSLQRLKERKRAIAHHMTTNLSKTVDLKLSTQAMDIAYLKRERDQIIQDRDKELADLKKQHDLERNQIMRRLDQIEATYSHFPSLMDRTETLKLVNATTKPLAERLEALEQSAAELPNLQKGLQDLATAPNRLGTVETRQNLVQPRPEPNQLNLLDIAELKSKLDRLGSLEAANGTLAKISKLESDVTTLKNAKELHKTDIDTLKTWKDGQPKAVSEETMRNLVITEVLAEASVLSKTLRKEADDADGKLAERITKNETSIRDFQTFKEKIEKQNLADQLTVLYDKVKTIEENDTRTYTKADRLQKRLKELEDEISPTKMDQMHDRMDKVGDNLHEKVDKLRERIEGTNRDLSTLEKDFSNHQEDIVKYIGRTKDDYKDTGFSLLEKVANLRTTVTQSDLGKLSIRLAELEKSVRNIDRLTTRVDELEKAPEGSSFRRVGMSVLPSSIADTPAMGNLDEKVNSLDQSLQQLRKLVTGKNGLSSRVDAQDERIHSLEAASASARPLDTVEQTTETTADRTTGENVMALMSTERKAVNRSLEELESRLLEEIQASRNQTHGSGISSVDATVAPLAQSGMSALNDIQQDLEMLFNKTETHDVTISSLSEFVPNLFNEHFDPFKTNVEEQLRTISNTLDTYGHDLSNLMQQVSNPPAQLESFGQQQQAQLEATVAETATLKTDFAALKVSLSTKADAVKMSQQLEGITFALNNLQSRYDNISTDDIYKRMVVWFTQLYPNFTQILEDISQLNALKAWVNHHATVINGLSKDAEELYSLASIATQLRDLANITPQLLNLANSAPALDQLAANDIQLQSLVGSHDASPETLAKIEQACSDAKVAITKAKQASFDASIAITKADQASSESQTANTRNAEIEQRLNEEVDTLENLSSSVRGIQKSLHNLNSDKSPFAKADVLSAAQRTIQTLQTHLDQEKKEREAGQEHLRTTMYHGLCSRVQEVTEWKGSINEDMQALRSDLDTDRSKRNTAEGDIKKLSNELNQMKSDYEAAVLKIWEQVHNIQSAGAELRTEFDTAVRNFDATVKAYIEPNRDFFGLLGTAIMLISQLQQAVESLNQNLPIAPLKLEWQCYLPTLGETNGEPSNSKGKGKSKQ